MNHHVVLKIGVLYFIHFSNLYHTLYYCTKKNISFLNTFAQELEHIFLLRVDAGWWRIKFLTFRRNGGAGVIDKIIWKILWQRRQKGEGEGGRCRKSAGKVVCHSRADSLFSLILSIAFYCEKKSAKAKENNPLKHIKQIQYCKGMCEFSKKNDMITWYQGDW
jgi:hypothetical protein